VFDLVVDAEADGRDELDQSAIEAATDAALERILARELDMVDVLVAVAIDLTGIDLTKVLRTVTDRDNLDERKRDVSVAERIMVMLRDLGYPVTSLQTLAAINRYLTARRAEIGARPSTTLAIQTAIFDRAHDARTDGTPPLNVDAARKIVEEVLDSIERRELNLADLMTAVSLDLAGIDVSETLAR
jgi:hypothetical protein